MPRLIEDHNKSHAFHASVIGKMLGYFEGDEEQEEPLREDPRKIDNSSGRRHSSVEDMEMYIEDEGEKAPPIKKSERRRSGALERLFGPASQTTSTEEADGQTTPSDPSNDEPRLPEHPSSRNMSSRKLRESERHEQFSNSLKSVMSADSQKLSRKESTRSAGMARSPSRRNREEFVHSSRSTRSTDSPKPPRNKKNMVSLNITGSLHSPRKRTNNTGSATTDRKKSPMPRARPPSASPKRTSRTKLYSTSHLRNSSRSLKSSEHSTGGGEGQTQDGKDTRDREHRSPRPGSRRRVQSNQVPPLATDNRRRASPSPRRSRTRLSGSHRDHLLKSASLPAVDVNGNDPRSRRPRSLGPRSSSARNERGHHDSQRDLHRRSGHGAESKGGERSRSAPRRLRTGKSRRDVNSPIKSPHPSNRPKLRPRDFPTLDFYEPASGSKPREHHSERHNSERHNSERHLSERHLSERGSSHRKEGRRQTGRSPNPRRPNEKSPSVRRRKNTEKSPIPRAPRSEGIDSPPIEPKRSRSKRTTRTVATEATS